MGRIEATLRDPFPDFLCSEKLALACSKRLPLHLLVALLGGFTRATKRASPPTCRSRGNPGRVDANLPVALRSFRYVRPTRSYSLDVLNNSAAGREVGPPDMAESILPISHLAVDIEGKVCLHQNLASSTSRSRTCRCRKHLPGYISRPIVLLRQILHTIIPVKKMSVRHRAL